MTEPRKTKNVNMCQIVLTMGGDEEFVLNKHLICDKVKENYINLLENKLFIHSAKLSFYNTRYLTCCE